MKHNTTVLYLEQLSPETTFLKKLFPQASISLFTFAQSFLVYIQIFRLVFWSGRCVDCLVREVDRLRLTCNIACVD